MPNSIFLTNNPKPTDEQLEEALGQAKELWDSFVAYVESIYSSIESEWKVYGKMTGWQLVFSYKGEKILHLTPGSGQFAVWFALNRDGVKRVKETKLPRYVREMVRTITPHYDIWAHSYSVTTSDELEHVKELFDIKLAT